MKVAESIHVHPTADTTIALSHIEVRGVMLVVSHSSLLEGERRCLSRLFPPRLISLHTPQKSCHQVISESLDDLKMEAVTLRDSVFSSVIELQEKVEAAGVTGRYVDMLRHAYNVAFEYEQGPRRLAPPPHLSDATLSLALATRWMELVLRHCEAGRGQQPRWAAQGLAYLGRVCGEERLVAMGSTEYQRLKTRMQECVCHVVGMRGGGRMKTVSEPVATHLQPHSHQDYPRSISADDAVMVPSSHQPHTDFIDGETRETRRMSRLQSVTELDNRREEMLIEMKRIGFVRGNDHYLQMVHVSNRKVGFHWQRGIKIGEGRFGKVYSAVNMDSNPLKLMAMKEIKFRPNDHKMLRDLADEIRTFECLQHPNLVKYYGVEVHKEELLIFMEYCEEGSLEEAVEACPGGLPENMIRRYTGDIVRAVAFLHERAIAHRDVKGANIFLTASKSLKLGDFGCSAKLGEHTTRPGELFGLVGTTAFMAPEMFTRPDGHGRASDVWSIGCVVIQMLTGRRPWPGLQEEYAIMYKVGIGHSPPYPKENISDEGNSFISHCLQHDPRERWSASQLQEHTFIKISEDD